MAQRESVQGTLSMNQTGRADGQEAAGTHSQASAASERLASLLPSLGKSLGLLTG